MQDTPGAAQAVEQPAFHRAGRRAGDLGDLLQGQFVIEAQHDHLALVRWQGVPFYLRSGKSLAEKSTEIIIQFKSSTASAEFSAGMGSTNPNILSFCLQQDEGFHQRFDIKVPDTLDKRRPVEMAFHYRDAFGESAIPEAYERLLLDALNGDASLFTRGDRAELAWELLDPILKAWKGPDSPPLYRYEPDSWGPAAADQLLERDGRSWLRVCGMHPNGIVPSVLS